jgi:hypothetical protein
MEFNSETYVSGLFNGSDVVFGYNFFDDDSIASVDIHINRGNHSEVLSSSKALYTDRTLYADFGEFRPDVSFSLIEEYGKSSKLVFGFFYAPGMVTYTDVIEWEIDVASFQLIPKVMEGAEDEIADMDYFRNMLPVCVSSIAKSL